MKAAWLTLAFLCGALVRAIPEALFPGIPIGFDTISYLAPTIHLWLESGINWTYAFQEGPLVYLAVYLPTALGADLFITLKVLGPIIYGLFAVGVIFFIKATTRLNWQFSFLSSVFVILQIVNLRLGWDLWRNLLGLTFILLMLAVWQTGNSSLVRGATLALSVLTVLTNQFAAAVLFATSVFAFVLGSAKERRRSIAVALVPSLLLFIVNLYSVIFAYTEVRQNVILLLQTRAQFTNYVTAFGSGFEFWNSFASFAVFALGILPLLAIIGLNRVRILAGFGLGSIAFSLWSIIFPSFGLPQWWRWLLLLGVPLSVYGAYGLVRIATYGSKLASRVSPLRQWQNAVRTILLVVLLIPFAIQASGYVASPQAQPQEAFVNTRWNDFFPPTLVGTSIRPEDVPSTISALTWLNGYAPHGAALLVEERFMGWGLMNLRSDLLIVVYPVHGNAKQALAVALSQVSVKQVFLIWLTGHDVEGFRQFQAFGNIAVFQPQT